MILGQHLSAGRSTVQVYDAETVGGSAITHLAQLDPRWDAYMFPSFLTMSTIDTSDSDMRQVFYMVCNRVFGL